VPKTIKVLSELPKTSSGKVDYPALRKREGL
jgi:acyl-coenzyme A synthetase/AMP-(fatty) acid ligase